MFDPIEYLEKIEQPTLLKRLGMTFLGFKSPFNRHLKRRLEEWTARQIKIRVTNHRGVQNHLSGVHAGALMTLGETCAGMLIIRNFKLSEYRPILMELSGKYERQVRKECVGECHLKAADVKRVRDGLKDGEPQVLQCETVITNERGEVAVRVQSKWQIKEWSQVKKK
jgi:acyl-coenzyme A thioesterase PaaI-like protein